MSSAPSKLRLPQIERVALRRFSLFTANPDAEFACGDGVLCLVGANGIGKSTLLSAINFGLTGIVSDPNRSFESMDEYYRFSRDFSSRYFRGRIDGNDQDDAEINVVFHIGAFRYSIRRGMFEPDELRSFTVVSAQDERVLVDTQETPRGERHRQYTIRFVEDTGLSSFEEFVFLQHFVLTFDENRRTLFWNQRVLERTLYRAFGLENNMAMRADAIRREIEQEDSRVRNSQWEATRKRRRINEIRAKTEAISDAKGQFDALAGDHKTLSLQFEDESNALRAVEDDVRDANLRLAEASVRETALREEYASYFDARFGVRPPPAQHPVVSQSLETHTCSVCGNTGDAAVAVIADKAKGPRCPLCDSVVVADTSSTIDPTRLQALDRELSKAKRDLSDVHKTLSALRTAEAKARSAFGSSKARLDAFERESGATLTALRNLLGETADDSLDDYHAELAALENEKDTAYARREDLKEKLLTLQSALEQHYLSAEREFVPLFANLAGRFLGMPLSVQLDARQSPGLNLVVSVKGTPRRQQQQLSESQRFFLDIALRMALIQYMSDPASRGGMLIDTPEGSLDIAYEKRAGDMLAMFAEAGHRILMTANLNSSQLLLAIARRCTREGMVLCRMTDWAELSQVQKEEEGLFDRAYLDIEKAMGTDAI